MYGDDIDDDVSRLGLSVTSDMFDFADDDIFVDNDNIVDAILPDQASCRVDNDYNDNDTY